MLMNKQPIVSILAISFNHEQFVVETLDSIINQDYPNVELIIVDDCSSDRTAEVIEQWKKDRNVDCVFIAHKENKGVCYSLNEALSHANGTYYQGISCDDILLPSKISTQVNAFNELDDDVAVLHSDAIVIDEDSKVTHPSFYEFWNFPTGTTQNEFKRLILQNTIIAPTVLTKVEIYRSLGFYDENLSYEDWDKWLRISKKYKIIKLDTPLTQYRHFSTSMSQGKRYRKVILEDSIVLLDKHRGISKEIDALVNEAQRPRITELIENNDAKLGHLWKKLKYEKSAYSLFLFLCGLVGLDQKQSHAIKNKLKR